MKLEESKVTSQQPADVSYIALHWAQLQPHVREAILTLIDAAMQLETKPASSDQAADHGQDQATS